MRELHGIVSEKTSFKFLSMGRIWDCLGILLGIWGGFPGAGGWDLLRGWVGRPQAARIASPGAVKGIDELAFPFLTYPLSPLSFFSLKTKENKKHKRKKTFWGHYKPSNASQSFFGQVKRLVSTKNRHVPPSKMWFDVSCKEKDPSQKISRILPLLIV